ncbi:hypothetical protein ACET3Z_025112 [Daucus carota]
MSEWLRRQTRNLLGSPAQGKRVAVLLRRACSEQSVTMVQMIHWVVSCLCLATMGEKNGRDTMELIMSMRICTVDGLLFKWTLHDHGYLNLWNLSSNSLFSQRIKLLYSLLSE